MKFGSSTFRHRENNTKLINKYDDKMLSFPFNNNNINMKNEINMYYRFTSGTDNPQINAFRIAQRVMHGENIY